MTSYELCPQCCAADCWNKTMQACWDCGFGTKIWRTHLAIGAVFRSSRFTGLWSYKPYKKKRRYCATVMAGGEPCETKMYDNWQDAVISAGDIINNNPK